MATLTTAYLNAVVNYLRGNGAPTAIGDIFLDLFNGDPQSGGSSVLNTLTGSSTRPSIKSAMGASSGGVSQNAALLTVIDPAVAGATVTHVAIYDAATAGNLVASHALSANQAFVAGNPVQFNAAGLQISLA